MTLRDSALRGLPRKDVELIAAGRPAFGGVRFANLPRTGGLPGVDTGGGYEPCAIGDHCADGATGQVTLTAVPADLENQSVQTFLPDLYAALSGNIPDQATGR